MRSPVDLLITAAALRAMTSNDFLTEAILEDEIPPNLSIKNVCAKVPQTMSDEIDNICSLLDIRKRRFLEAAMIEAISKAHAIIEAEGVHEHYVSLTEAHEAHKAEQERSKGSE